MPFVKKLMCLKDVDNRLRSLKTALEVIDAYSDATPAQDLQNMEVAVAELSKLRLNRFFSTVLKVVNFVVKIFIRSRSTALDHLLLRNREVEEITHLVSRVDEVAGDIRFLKEVLVINGSRLEIESSYYSLNALVLSKQKNKLESFWHSFNEIAVDSDQVEQSYAALPDYIKELLCRSVIAFYSQENLTLRDGETRIQTAPETLLTMTDLQGDNAIKQVGALLAEKENLYRDLSLLTQYQSRVDETLELLEQLSATGKELLSPSDSIQPEDIEKAITEISKSRIPHINEILFHSKACFNSERNIYDVSVDRIKREIPAADLNPPLSIAMVGVEYASLLKEGGLAEAIEGMTKGLKELNPENKLRLVFPKYHTLPPAITTQLEAEEPQEYRDLNGEAYHVYTLDIDGIECLFVDHALFNGESSSFTNPYQDSPLKKARFAKFSALAADLLHRFEDVDVIHLHDWHVAGVGIELKKQYPEEWESGKIPPVVFTFHNNTRSAQGRCGNGPYKYTETINGLREAGILEEEDNYFIKALQSADAVTTVSEQFGLEAQDLKTGEGVSFIVKEAAKVGKLTGILNGIDLNRWNPATDTTLKEWIDISTGKAIDLTYTPEDTDLITKKERCKEQLVQWAKQYMPHADIDGTKPLVTFIGRLDSYQKGLDVLDEAIEATLVSGGQFVVMGSLQEQDEKAAEILEMLKAKYTKGVLFIEDYKDESGRWHWQQESLETGRPGIGPIVRGATEFTVVPSKLEPCGYVQFEGWVFGSQVIASDVGGLKESVITKECDPLHANGALFSRHGPRSQKLSVVLKAELSSWLDMNQEERRQRIKNIMVDGGRRGWTDRFKAYSPAEQYRLVYENARFRAKKRNESELTFNLRDYLYVHVDKSAEKDASTFRYPGERLYKDYVYGGRTQHFEKTADSASPQWKEEQYWKLYLSERSSREELDAIYEALDPAIRATVPHPYGRDINFSCYQEQGSHLTMSGTRFTVNGPGAKEVLVRLVDDESREIARHSLSLNDTGLFTAEIEGVAAGQSYQYLIDGKEKIDPYGLQQYKSQEAVYSVVVASDGYLWSDEKWIKHREKTASTSRPMAILEVHPSSWKRVNGKPMNYRMLAEELVAHCQKTGFTHVELMGVMDHHKEDSWGYRVTGFFSPNERMGSMDDFKYMVNYLHDHDIAVVLDWIPAHFSRETYGLSEFGGKDHYEPGFWRSLFSPREWIFQRLKERWDTYFFNYRKKEVREFLTSSAMYWIQEMHIDALRVDAVLSMLISDDPKSSRLFLRDLNAVILKEGRGALTIAEESYGYDEITRSFATGGLGFDMKWNMGWTHHILKYFSKPLEERGAAYQQLIRAIRCDTNHKMVLALSHDDVKQQLKTLLEKTPGLSSDEQVANLRLLLSFMYALPGKKLMMMGSEIGNKAVWDGYVGKDRGLMDSEGDAPHAESMMAAVKGLNELYQENSALFDCDDNAHDLEEITFDDPQGGICAFRRKGKLGETVATFHNFSNTEELCYRIPLSSKGAFRGKYVNGVVPEEEEHQGFPKEIFNSDAELFGGLNRLNENIHSVKDADGRVIAYEIRIPPLSSVFIQEQGPVAQEKAMPSPRVSVEKTSSFTAIATIVKKALNFLRRYFRRVRFDHKVSRLEPEKVAEYTPYVLASYATHRGKKSWFEGMPSLDFVELSTKSLFVSEDLADIEVSRDYCFLDKKTGLKVALVKHDDEIILSFGTLNTGEAELVVAEDKDAFLAQQKKAIGKELLGGTPEVYTRAVHLVEALEEQGFFSGKQIVVTGQCFGASIAQYVSLKKEIKGVCFNSLPLGAGLQADIAPEVLERAKDFLTVFSVEGDYASDSWLYNMGKRICDAVGLCVPSNFGHRVSIPSGYKSAGNTHIHVLGSMMHYLGYDAWFEFQKYVEAEALLMRIREELDNGSLENKEELLLTIELMVKMDACHSSLFLPIKDPTPLHQLIEKLGLTHSLDGYSEALTAHIAGFSPADQVVLLSWRERIQEKNSDL